MTYYTATYSPDDNKLRLYATARLDAETYSRVKAAGFKWAPKQDLFVAPMWTPQREDLLLELAGEIGDEDSSLVDRAEVRAERFEDYGEKRLSDAHAARKAVGAIADGIPFGQPILVGHHSERRARRDAEKIDNGMRKAVKMWRTSQYWEYRAKGALRHAKYKERPDVRARRIKTIEADKRKTERSKAESGRWLKAWSTEGLTLEVARKLANICNLHLPRKEGDKPDWQYAPSVYDVLREDPSAFYAPRTLAEVVDHAKTVYPRSMEHCDRWLEHYDNRLVYERAMLDEAGASDLLKPKPRRELAPLLNYRAEGGSITTDNMYDRNRSITYAQVDMTKAEYARINVDYKGARLSQDKSHRFRTAMVKHSLVAVFLTDSKVHELPSARETVAAAEPIEDEAEAIEAPELASVADPIAEALALAHEIAPPLPPADLPDPSPTADFEAMAATLRNGGVKVVSAPQLFPTPRDLAAEMVEIAGIEAGQEVLEPSAGTGALVMPALARGAVVDTIEISTALARGLCGRDVRRNMNRDFLEFEPDPDFTYDRILMNPPFVNGADIEHIEHARKFLKPGGRLVAICADGPRQRERLQPIASEWRSLPPGTFKDSGTMVNAALLVIDG